MSAGASLKWPEAVDGLFRTPRVHLEEPEFTTLQGGLCSGVRSPEARDVFDRDITEKTTTKY